MFLTLVYTKLDIFAVSKSFVLTGYKETKSFPSEEKFGMISQIKSAALSAHLNVAEGTSRKYVVERKRYYEIARCSVIEIDAALDITVDLEYRSKQRPEELGKLMLRSFQMISKMIS